MKKVSLILSLIILSSSLVFGQGKGKVLRAKRLVVSKSISLQGQKLTAFDIKNIDQQPQCYAPPYFYIYSMGSSILLSSKQRGSTRNDVYVDIVYDDRDLSLDLQIIDHPGWDDDTIRITYQTNSSAGIMTVVQDVLNLFASNDYISSNFNFMFPGFNPHGTFIEGQPSNYFEPGKDGSMFDQPDMVFLRDTTQMFTENQYMFLKKDSTWYRFTNCKSYY